MTREEAIEILKDLWTYLQTDIRQALEMAIKALEHPEKNVIAVVPCGDTISRQAVQDYIAKFLSQYLYNDVRETIEEIDEYIGELPPVNPQPKTGHWIEGEVWEDTDGGWGRWQKCSVCRQSKHHKTNFCPDCGTKMECGDKE